MRNDDELEVLRQAVRRFVERHIAPHVDRWEDEEGFPRELYREFGAAGFLGAGFDEAYGGTPATMAHQLVICEEIVRAGSSGLAASLCSHAIAAPPIAAFGSAEQKARFLPPILRGEAISALAVTEPDGGSDVAGLRTRAVRDGDEYVVSGSKMFITSGTRADLVTTAVRTGGPGPAGISVLVIEGERPGVRRSRKLKKMGWAASDTAEIAFEGCRVPVANRLGREGGGFPILMHNFAGERLLLAVMALVMAEQALTAALGYARDRKAFGRAIGRFQVLRHLLAEMTTRLTVARSYTAALVRRPATAPVSPAEAAMAKNSAVDAAMFVIDAAVQIHGGAGYMRESLVERLYRDIRLFHIGGGTREIMNEIIARPLDL